MTDLKKKQGMEAHPSRGRSYEPPRVIIIGPLEQITLKVSGNLDGGGTKKN